MSYKPPRELLDPLNQIKWLSQPMRIVDQSWSADTVPVVSICCITYNHEKYIRECLDGFLMQETTFPVEILIHDDASTDATATIVREYETRLTGIIKPIYQDINQYSKGIKINATFNFSRVKGKYIAMCEGDDYWTSPFKLQCQFDYLEKHPESSGCFHNVRVLHEATKTTSMMFSGPQKNKYNLEEIAEANRIPTLSVFFRAHLFKEFPEWYYKMPIGDWPLHVLNAEHGDFGFINQVLATYRKHEGGVWSSLQEARMYEKTIVVAKAINKHLNNKYGRAIGRNIAYWHYLVAKNYAINGNLSASIYHSLGAMRVYNERISRSTIVKSLLGILFSSLYG